MVIPRNPPNRVIAQKSVFIRHPQGCFKPEERNIIIIRASQKKELLLYLRRYQGISVYTIYNDLHGYIKHQHLHGDAYSKFYEGVAWIEKGDDAKAKICFDRSIELNPNSAAAFHNRGLLHKNQEHFDLAMNDLNRAIELDPDLCEAYNARGILCTEQCMYDLAIGDLTKVLELLPNDAGTYVNRGKAYAKDRDFEKALIDFKLALSIDENLAIAHFNIGLLHILDSPLKSIDEARNCFSRALEIDSSLIETLPDNVKTIVMETIADC